MGPLQKWELHWVTRATKKWSPKVNSSDDFGEFFLSQKWTFTWTLDIKKFSTSRVLEDPKIPSHFGYFGRFLLKSKNYLFWEDYHIWDASFARILFLKNVKKTNLMISQNQLLDSWIKIRTFHLQGGWSGVKWYHLSTWMGGSGSGSTLPDRWRTKTSWRWFKFAAVKTNPSKAGHTTGDSSGIPMISCVFFGGGGGQPGVYPL